MNDMETREECGRQIDVKEKQAWRLLWIITTMKQSAGGSRVHASRVCEREGGEVAEDLHTPPRGDLQHVAFTTNLHVKWLERDYSRRRL